ncbi:MAG: MarR family winged helix-turn-helix transcriptional regulator [Pseudomonadota bacterium]
MTSESEQQAMPHNADDGHAYDDGNLAKSPLHLLHRAGQRAGDVFQSEMTTGDLTPRQYAVLVTVSQHEGLSQTNLVERTGIDRSTLADIIRRMLKKGLLQRRRTKEDARAYAVKLTDEGRRVLENATPLADRVDQKVLAVLPDKEERARFLQDLNLIIEALGRVDFSDPVGDPSRFEASSMGVGHPEPHQQPTQTGEPSAAPGSIPGDRSS